jgi:hypothetical protein
MALTPLLVYVLLVLRAIFVSQELLLHKNALLVGQGPLLAPKIGSKTALNVQLARYVQFMGCYLRMRITPLS